MLPPPIPARKRAKPSLAVSPDNLRLATVLHSLFIIHCAHNCYITISLSQAPPTTTEKGECTNPKSYTSDDSYDLFYSPNGSIYSPWVLGHLAARTRLPLLG